MIPTHAEGSARPSGIVTVQKLPARLPDDGPPVMTDLSVLQILKQGFPQKGLPVEVNRWRRGNVGRLMRGAKPIAIARSLGLSYFHGALWVTVIRADGRVIYYGLGSLRFVTNAGVAQLANALKNTFEPENFNYHGIGTGSTAENVADTQLVTELTTQYNPDNTRATGTQSTPSANVYRTIGTNLVDSAVTIQEHMIASQAATGGGTCLDRSVVSSVGLANGDSIQTTYDFTIAAGG